MNFQTLRDTLNRSGLTNVKLVAADGGWGIGESLKKDKRFSAAVDIVGYV